MQRPPEGAQRAPADHCAESEIDGEKPHLVAGKAERCRIHQAQRSQWVDLNRKRRKGGRPEIPWHTYVKPRPRTDRGVELTGDDLTAIRESIAHLATVKAPIDSSILRRAESVRTVHVEDLLEATNQLLYALSPVADDT